MSTEPTGAQLDALHLAERARVILDDPLVKEALAAIEGTIIDAWVDCAVDDRARAEDLKRLLWAGKQWRAFFDVAISGGAVANYELTNSTTMQVRRDAALERLRNGY